MTDKEVLREPPERTLWKQELIFVLSLKEKLLSCSVRKPRYGMIKYHVEFSGDYEMFDLFRCKALYSVTSK
jgi:hypothetical protein